MFQAPLHSSRFLIVLSHWIAFFDGLFQPMHLLVIGIIAILLFGKSVPDIARWLGKKSVEFRLRRPLGKNKGDSGSEPHKRDDEQPGACPARLDPPDKPRPPAQVALTRPKSSEDQGEQDPRNFSQIS
jgi:Sec-independent protein translocase protein TatA